MGQRLKPVGKSATATPSIKVETKFGFSQTLYLQTKKLDGSISKRSTPIYLYSCSNDASASCSLDSTACCGVRPKLFLAANTKFHGQTPGYACQILKNSKNYQRC